MTNLRLVLLVLGLVDALGTGYLALAPSSGVTIPPAVSLAVGLVLVGAQFLTTNLRSWQDAGKQPETPATETPTGATTRTAQTDYTGPPTR